MAQVLKISENTFHEFDSLILDRSAGDGLVMR